MSKEEYINAMREYGFPESEIDMYLQITEELGNGEELIDYEPFIPPFIDIE